MSGFRLVDQLHSERDQSVSTREKVRLGETGLDALKTSILDERIDARVVPVIEHVDEVRAEIKVRTLIDLYPLDQGEVPGVGMEIAQGVATRRTSIRPSKYTLGYSAVDDEADLFTRHRNCHPLVRAVG